jgi:hypothetical protein
VRVRDDDRRDAERRHLGQRRRSGPPDHEIRGHQGRQHVIAQERVGSIARSELRRETFAGSQRLGVARLAGDVDDVAALDDPWQRLGNGRVEAEDGLRSAEDEHHPRIGREVEPLAGLGPIDRRRVPDRRARHEPRLPGTRERPPRRLVGDGDRTGEAGRQPDGPAWNDIAVPEDDRDPHGGGSHEGRDRHVAAGREDRRRSLPGEDRRCLRDRDREAQRIEDRVDAHVDRSQRAQGQPPDGMPRGSDQAGLEAAMAPDPDELRCVRSIAQRPGHGEGWVDVPARAASRDQQSHRSTFLVRRFLARSKAGCRRPRG